MDKKEIDRIYYLKNRESIIKRRKQRYQENKEKELEQQKKYKEKNIDKITEYQKIYSKSKKGRANKLIQKYRLLDKEANRGECTLTVQWMIENIFNGHCIYCGETDWRKLGCDRIDNSKPHTPDNVVCCCYDCNVKRGTKPYEEFMKEMQQKMLEEFETP